MSTTITRAVTADELLAMPDDGFCYELIKGELIRMSPPGAEHGSVTMRVAGSLYQHVEQHSLGVVYAAKTGFKLAVDPDTVRAPDVAFVSKTRTDREGSVQGYWIGAPDLAVEVLSPHDRSRKVDQKVANWLEAGARMVWVVSSRLRTITVYRSLTDIVVLTEKDTLDGDDVVSGFLLLVADVFQS